MLVAVALSEPRFGPKVRPLDTWPSGCGNVFLDYSNVFSHSIYNTSI